MARRVQSVQTAHTPAVAAAPVPPLPAIAHPSSTTCPVPQSLVFVFVPAPHVLPSTMPALAPPAPLPVEPVGAAFVRRAFRQTGARPARRDAAPAVAAPAAAMDDTLHFELDEWHVEHRPTSGKNKGKVMKRVEFDYYKILGLHADTTEATPTQIKKAYQIGILKFHPDKIGGENPDAMFLKIQEAYQHLIDPAKRRAYDSLYDFNDAVPTTVKKQSDFYRTFGPVFARNARFSVARPVPALGDARTSIEEVHAFYQFWGKFESWRNFTLKDEHTIEDADGRDEKRWMEQQNKSQRAARKKKEYQRLRKLYEAAIKLDPRILAHAAAEKERKAQAKAAKAAAAAKALADQQAQEQAEAARRAQEEAARKDAVKVARDQRAKQKKLLKKARKAFMAAYMPLSEHDQATCSMDDLQNITDEADLEDLQRLAAALTGAAGDDAALAAALTETAALATAIAGK